MFYELQGGVLILHNQKIRQSGTEPVLESKFFPKAFLENQ